MEKQGTVIDFQRFTWRIQDFSKKKTKDLPSNSFQVGDCKWRIVVHQIEKSGEQYLCLILKVADHLLPSFRWRKFAHIKLILINQMDSSMSIVKETQQKFNAGYKAWGSPFVHLSDFYNTMFGFLVNKTCIIEAELSISDDPFNIQDNLTTQFPGDEAAKTNMKEPKQLEDQGIDSLDDTSSFTSLESVWSQASQIPKLQLPQQENQGIVGPSHEAPSPKQVHNVPSAPLYPCLDDEPEEAPLISLSELIDFSSLEPEELAFVPLLEEVCSWHPSLIERQRRRSARFIHWAFIALGRVLYFLKTMKVRDMSEDTSCRHLHGLWEELEAFGFELNWLEPHVQSALGMKAYLERAERVRKLKEEVVALGIEMKKLRVKLAVAEVDLNIEKRHLAEEEKGFEEIDMDAQLCYGVF